MPPTRGATSRTRNRPSNSRPSSVALSAITSVVPSSSSDGFGPPVSVDPHAPRREGEHRPKRIVGGHFDLLEPRQHLPKLIDRQTPRRYRSTANTVPAARPDTHRAAGPCSEGWGHSRCEATRVRECSFSSHPGITALKESGLIRKVRGPDEKEHNMTRPARWKVFAFAAALIGLGMAGAATATAESSSTGSDTSTSRSSDGSRLFTARG